MERIRSLDDVQRDLAALLASDERLVAVRAVAGELPLRLSEPGFSSLASIIVSQQVSLASAAAIFGRLSRLIVPLEAAQVLAADPALFREAGLSRPKVQALLALAEAVEAGLDLNHLCTLEADVAIAELVAVKGIGPWTAQVYLLFCAGHPDIFPVKDVALQAAVGHAFGLESRPSEKALTNMVQAWSPWRATASRLFWAYYRAIRGRDGAPNSPQVIEKLSLGPA